MQRFYHWIRHLFKRKRPLSAAEIERRLGASALEALRKEVYFLKHTHGVTVSTLKDGEKPRSPRAADPAVEERLTAP